MHLHRISKTVGYISYLRSESKVFVSRNGSFLEERFLSKELSGRVVELDEVIEPSLQPVCSRAQEVVPVAPTPIEVEADDSDHWSFGSSYYKPRRSTRSRTAAE